ncbi:MAG: uracil-DNA glycosylase [Alphaproteobacteria bacterium]|nr:uracil-DNA glycosylase [Alphaproteobacteria bacterium]
MNNIEKLVQFYKLLGIEDLVQETSRSFFEKKEEGALKSTSAKEEILKETTPQNPSPTAMKEEGPKTKIFPASKFSPNFKDASPHKTEESFLAEAIEKSATANSLEDLEKALTSFEGCALKKTAIHTVFGQGVLSPDVMFIGEAPGEEEDRQGIPFIGASGQLLNKMLDFIGLSRQKNMYISNIIPWRPPGNRNPTPNEVELCLPFIKRHIELLNPKCIVCIGGVAAKSLLQTTEIVSKLRGNWHTLSLNGKEYPLFCIYHPSYLLRTPIAKKATWFDLLKLKEALQELH